MHRTLARIVFVLVSGLMAAVLGITAALLFSPPGRRLLVRVVTQEADRLVRGTVSIGSVTGNWVGGLKLERVVIRDTTGELLADLPRVEVQYRLFELLAGRMVFGSLRLYRPVISVVKRRNGRLNYQEIFRQGEGPAGPRTTSAQLVEIRELTIDSGTVTITLPWNPDGRLKTARQVDSALAFERTKPGRRIEAGREGLSLVRTIENLNTSMPLLRLSSPDDAPTLVRIGRLGARISDPGLTIVDLQAELRTKNDSLVFSVARAELPRTSMSGAGRLDWPQDTILYHYNLEASRVALADLRFISPGFPDFTGSGRVAARSISTVRTEYDIRDLALGDANSRVTGRLMALTDIHRGLGFRRLGLQLTNLDLDVVRFYLDSLPFHGTITGRLGADGFFTGMTVSLDWLFRDAAVPGGAESRLGLDGTLRLGGADGMYFQGARLSNTDVDIRTVRQVAPAVILEGRLGLAGTLDGPLKNVTFDGLVEHRDEGRPPSRLNGKVRLDTRGAVLGLETDMVLDSLSFDGIRRSFPTLTLQGSLGGPVRLAGTLERLAVDADVGGAIGRIHAVGTATLMPPRWAADSLRLIFSRVNLAAMSPRAPVTVLQGTMDVTGTVDSATAPSGRLAITLGAGRIREFALDSGSAVLRAADSLIMLDTLRAAFPSGRVNGSGTIGWTSPKTGRIAIHAEADSLAPFDSLALAVTGLSRDTTVDDAVMEGKAVADLTLEGALDALQVTGDVSVDPFRWLSYYAADLRTRFVWTSGTSGITASVEADTLNAFKKTFTAVQGTMRGRTDSMDWSGSMRGWDSMRVAGAGRYEKHAGRQVFHADSLNLDLLGRGWRLTRPLTAVIADSLIQLDTVSFQTSDGAGSVLVAGGFSRGARGDLSITAMGIELRELYGLMQSDTTGIAGSVVLDARVSGTSAAPELRGTGSLTGGVFGDFKAPLIRAAFDYRNHLLRSNLTFWRTGVPVVEADASLPLDLAFGRVEDRKLEGPLTITVVGDSVDLGIIEAFTPNVRRVTGFMDMDVRVEGSWSQPRLAGQMSFNDGAADLPALGVRYGPITGGFRFTGDSIRTEKFRIAGEHGELTIGGGIRLEQLTRPILGLELSAQQFDVIDVPDFLKLELTGDLTLSGPLLQPTLTGAARVANSVIYFSDLVTKEIINLDDPLVADLVDAKLLKQQGLGSSFQSRFLDSLRINDLDFIAAEDVWLRSLEANFQLEGRLRVNKFHSTYRIDGNLNTPRGTYTLGLGPIRRTFTVERGSVRYFGDLNAELDVQARHVVRSTESSAPEVPVIAHITGTLQVPKLTLRTDPGRPPISEQELISLLVAGSTDPRALAQIGAGSPEAVGAYALGMLTSEVQRALISSSGSGLDIVEIRPGFSSSGLFTTVRSPTQILVGKAITSKLFLTANAGFCIGSDQGVFSARNLGASIEYRFRRELSAVISAEPVQTCAAGTELLIRTRRYQFGADLRWDRDY